MWIADKWTDYELLDAADGMRLERWGEYVLERPDPQVIWKTQRRHPRWETPDASYRRSASGGGAWSEHSLPSSWTLGYGDLRFTVRPMNFKHTGLFPEQAVNWDAAGERIRERIHRGKTVKLLNLFAYTGASTVACAKAGAAVTHVDAARGMVARARDNAALNGVQARWIVEDCRRFLERELRRGSRYDAVILDPPSYGRGPVGEVWRLEDDVYDLLDLISQLLSDDAAFVFLSAYTAGLAPGVLTVLLDSVFTSRFGGRAEARELGIPIRGTSHILPCGATGRWNR
ncbi:MAG: class I SAM-dependent methyltransferase [Oscillospiraceae bacterium]|nr:class I SAM-dependent methyltransferase [Oscillospiraceae bacterium]